MAKSRDIQKQLDDGFVSARMLSHLKIDLIDYLPGEFVSFPKEIAVALAGQGVVDLSDGAVGYCVENKLELRVHDVSVNADVVESIEPVEPIEPIKSIEVGEVV